MFPNSYEWKKTPLLNRQNKYLFQHEYRNSEKKDTASLIKLLKDYEGFLANLAILFFVLPK